MNVKVSHPEKVLFPDDGITKGELAEYYRKVAHVMLPHVRGRPLTMERFPEGIGGQGFMQKEAPGYFPAWIGRAKLPKKKGTTDYVVCDNEDTIVYLANQNCITLHVWLSRAERPHNPDMLLIDLDPSDDDFSLVRATALRLRDVLSGLGLEPFVKTTGSRGLHVAAPLDGKSSFDETGAFAHEVATALVERNPDTLTMEPLKANREGRLYLDVGRNTYAQHAAVAYTVRARPGAPVSMPVAWEEVEDDALSPRAWTVRNALKRLEGAGDLWAAIDQSARPLPQSAPHS